MSESPLSDICYTVRDCQFCQVVVVERAFLDALQRGGQRDAGQIVAVIEEPCANAGNALPDDR